MTAYYNENDSFAAQWLRNLVAAGHIAPGDVDERSISDVRADDLRGYTQCHFFAGIGGWSHALRLAGWGDDDPVWTGSCPCQPFSAAGKREGFADERHLWPVWFNLIGRCKPAIVFGEQVAAAIKGGWLDAVFTDLEGEDYACGATVLPACGVGAPHIRQRLWFVAHADKGRSGRDTGAVLSAQGEAGWQMRSEPDSAQPRSAVGELADPNGGNASAEGLQRSGQHRQQPEDGRSLPLADPLHSGRPKGRTIAGDRSAAGSGIHWRDAEFIPCTDGKARPVEPGTFPLAHGILGRVGRLRAYGNAIVPQAAAEFIGAFMDFRNYRLNVEN